MAEDRDALEREIRKLRLRVAELQRRLAGPAPEALAPLVAEHERLLEVERTAHMGSWIWDLDTDEVVWSDELYRIFGYEPGPGIASTTTFHATLHPDDRERVRLAADEGIRTGIAPQIDCRLLRRDGTVREVSIAGTFIFDETGRARRNVGTILDLTEAREIERRLAHADKMQAIGRLAGGIAHEFNNLLMVMRGNLDAVASRSPEIANVLRAIASARELTDRLLALGRQSNLRRRVHDLNELAAETVELVGRLLGESIRVELTSASEPLCVDVDATLVQQALVNLLLNARDVLPNGGTIRIETRAEARDGETFASLTVRDDGCGMDEHTRERAFDPFFSTKPEGSGHGMGLATVLGTIEQHGGTMHVDSAPGRGSAFTLRLPRCEGPPVERSPAPPEAAPPTSPRRILVVEDQPAVAATLEMLLQLEGHATTGAHSAAEALERSDAAPDGFDLVLCDVVMPDMRGPALVARINEHRARPVPVVFMSGYAAGTLTDLGREAHVLTKPFTLDELRSAIQRALGP